jgi:hypothetical protein
MNQRHSFFHIEAGRTGDIWVDDCYYSFLQFRRDFSKLLEIKKEFRVVKACSLVTDGQVNKIKILIKDNGGTLV